MEIVIQPDAEAAAHFVADRIAAQLRRKPLSVLGLATGRTMEAVYARLAALHRDEGLRFCGVRAFNLDEYLGLAPDDPASYRAYMNRHIFDHVDLPLDQTHVPDGTATDPAAECRSFEERIREAGGIDLQLLGLGATGHIGFNEPLSPFESRTRPVILAPETLRQNAGPFGGDPARVPRLGLTMGVRTILEARALLMLVTGAAKADVLARVVEGPLTAMASGTAIQLHKDCCVVADEAAAAKLAERDYYRWVRKVRSEDA